MDHPELSYRSTMLTALAKNIKGEPHIMYLSYDQHTRNCFTNKFLLFLLSN